VGEMKDTPPVIMLANGRNIMDIVKSASLSVNENIFKAILKLMAIFNMRSILWRILQSAISWVMLDSKRQDD